MLKRVAVLVDDVGTAKVDLPTYRMVAGSWLGASAASMHADGFVPGQTIAALQALAATVEVNIPDDTPLDAAGQIDAAAMRKRYAEHPRFGSDAWVPPHLS